MALGPTARGGQERPPEADLPARFARNMQPEHLKVAQNRGSWGVGRWVFRVRVEDERLFELYYDRAPKDALNRKGYWFLRCELERG